MLAVNFVVFNFVSLLAHLVLVLIFSIKVWLLGSNQCRKDPNGPNL